MAVPSYDKFIEPILRYLAAHSEGAPARDVYDAAAKVLGLSKLDRDELLPSGTQAVFKNRAGWAHDRLKRAGYSNSPRRGFWQLNEMGIALAKKHRAALPAALIEDIATGHDDVRLRDGVDGSATLDAAPAAETIEKELSPHHLSIGADAMLSYAIAVAAASARPTRTQSAVAATAARTLARHRRLPRTPTATQSFVTVAR